MKRAAMIKRTAALVLAAAACALLAAGQTPTAIRATELTARVSAVLERFPAETSAARDALCAELIKLGPPGLIETCSRVFSPGAGNDAKARFAVNGLAVHVTRTGAEAERQMFVKALLASLSGRRDDNVAAFFIPRQLACHSMPRCRMEAVLRYRRRAW